MALPLDSLLDTLSARIIAAAEELTALDSAIGDADHGLNMKRGFEAVQAERTNILAKPTGEALKTVGMTLVMKVGGASGPLYGTLFMTLGKELPEDPTLADIGRALQASVLALKARGKADVGNFVVCECGHGHGFRQVKFRAVLYANRRRIPTLARWYFCIGLPNYRWL